MTSINSMAEGGPEYTVPQCRHFNYDAGDDERIARLGFGVPALDLAALGYAVLPLARGAKRPHEMLGATGGVHHASNDSGQIRYWFEIEDRFSNVGVRTGQLPFPGRQLCVIDLDTKHGHDGPAIFRQFLAGNGLSLPPGLPVDRSPTGGYHLSLGWPPGWGPCPERQSILGGVDVKGDSGYVVVPPSYLRVPSDDHDGHPPGEVPVPYLRESGCPCWLPWAPPWFGEWIATAPATGRPQGDGGSSSGGGIDAEKVIASGAPVGARNTTLYKLACSRYRKHGTSLEGAAVVLDEVRAAWEAGDTAGFSERELLVCVESARKFIERQEQAEHRAYLAWLAAMGGAR